jgi:hypothetical protein
MSDNFGIPDPGGPAGDTATRSAEVSSDQLSAPSVERTPHSAKLTSQLLREAAHVIAGWHPIVIKSAPIGPELEEFLAELRRRAALLAISGRSCAEAAATFPQHTKHPK